MKLIKCPKCGEMYSDSYKTCPFCQEDEALKGRAAAPRRKVTRRRRAPSILGPAMVLVVVLAVAASLGRIGEDLWWGYWQLGPWRLHPLVLLFALSGSLMISKTLRIPKP